MIPYNCFHVNWQVSYTCNSGVLIQIGTEPLRNKPILTYWPNCLFILIKGAIFKTYSCIYLYKTTSYFTSAVIKLKLTMSISLHKRLQYKERDFRNQYSIRTCSVTTILVTSIEFNPIRCSTTLCHFDHTRNGSVANFFVLLSSTSTSSATGGYILFRNACAKKRNQLVKMRNGLGTSLVLVQKVTNRRTVKLCMFVTCNHLFLVLVHLFHLIGRIHCLHLRNAQLKTFWSRNIKFLPHTDWTMG